VAAIAHKCGNNSLKNIDGNLDSVIVSREPASKAGWLSIYQALV
jgi:hypothetical protein